MDIPLIKRGFNTPYQRRIMIMKLKSLGLVLLVVLEWD